MLRPGQATREILSVPTEVVLQIYVDRVLILVTQLGKVGALIQASLPSNTPLDLDTVGEGETVPEPSPYPALPPPPASIALTPLLGASSNNPLHSLYVSQIATLVWAVQARPFPGAGVGATLPVAVGLALRGGGTEDPAMFHGVMGLVREVLEQS
ncbi:hypothetical protein K488DRAFT_44550 [Vararia minispora EC-137]|uniref:Uncharacterized protein n=1 Tax=Vararia minispora EC-137 TaxID=1314806 RepID=A0ACB8QT35_9AGAM|nr:hypothetical protein K488DRAFT_44550 [Vararia minispora EC-137]